MITKTSEWYQPADVAIVDPLPSYYNLGINSEWGRGYIGNVELDFSVVDFGAAAAGVAGGNTGSSGVFDVFGAGYTSDYAIQGPSYFAGSNLPVYGTGFVGSSIPAGIFGAASWNMQAEASIHAMTSAGFYAEASQLALDDPALPYNDPSLWPPNAIGIVGVEWEHELFPAGLGTDYIGLPVDANPWLNGSSIALEVVVTSVLSSVETNRPWPLGISIFTPADVDDITFNHVHGTTTEVTIDGSSVPGEEYDAAYPGLPNYPTMPPFVDIVPPSFDVGDEYLRALDSFGIPTIGVSYVHTGMYSGGFDFNVGDGVTSGYSNQQRAQLTPQFSATMRPSRVRFIYELGLEPALRLFQRDDDVGPVRTARLGKNVDIGNGPSSLQRQQAPRLPQGGNTYR